jgi:hypothetical protein
LNPPGAAVRAAGAFQISQRLLKAFSRHVSKPLVHRLRFGQFSALCKQRRPVSTRTVPVAVELGCDSALFQCGIPDGATRSCDAFRVRRLFGGELEAISPSNQH